MPSRAGLDRRAPEPTAESTERVVLTRNPDGSVTLPEILLACAGLDGAEEIEVEVGAGVRLVPDSLRKVYVEITARCNLNCATCVRHAWTEAPGDMPPEHFERLLGGLAPEVVTLAFGGYGEPLVHPNFIEFVSQARRAGHQVELITNGLLLDAARARRLVAEGVAQVTISIDGGDAAAYASVRGSYFDNALESARLLNLARRRARSPLRLGLAFVATRRNIGSLPALWRTASDLSADFLTVSNVVPHTPEMADEALWRQGAWAANFRSDGWRPRLLMAPIDLHEASRAALGELWQSELAFPPSALSGGAARNHCRFAHEGVVAVGWDGRVAPCLSLLHSHPEYVNGHRKRVDEWCLGQIDKTPLTEIWHEAAFTDFRRRLRTFDFPACFVCGGCPATEDNAEDCYGNPFPACGECLWAQGLVTCP